MLSVVSESPITANRPVTAKVVAGPVTGTWTVTFKAAAVPGTLAVLAGTLSAARLDIVSAVIGLSADGTVADAFDVVPLDGGELEPTDAERLAAAASLALSGRHDLSAQLAQLRQRHPATSSVAPSVDFQLDSELTTGVRIVCADRPGLLHDLAAALTAHGLRTRSISVLTFGGRAHDVFRIVDANSNPPKDQRVLGRVRDDLIAVCG